MATTAHASDASDASDAPDAPDASDASDTSSGIGKTLRSEAEISSATAASRPESGRHAWLLTAIVLGGLAMIGTVNRVVDPYRIFSVDRDAVYADYPALHANIRLHKAHQVNRQRPDAIVLGTSKAIQGIPLDHPRFAGRRVYNLAMPLATMEENARLLRHAFANGPVADVVFAIDFLSFNVHARTDGPAAGFDPARLKGTPGEPARLAPDRLAALLSFDALQSSVTVLRGAGDGSHRVLTGIGGREDAEIRSRLADGGHRSNTARIEAFFTDSVYLPAPQRAFAFVDDTTDSLAWFEAFVRDAHAFDASPTLLIGPSHARLWELVRVAGLWSIHEAWKRALVEINERVAGELGRSPFALWDFTLPGPVTTEPFPDAGDVDTRMVGYYESIHFDQTTGARVLDRIAEDPDGMPAEAPGDAFGLRLTGQNIEATLGRARDGQAAFRAANPEQIREIEGIVGAVRGAP